MVTLYKRSSNGKPLVWRGYETEKADFIIVEYGLVGGKLHKEQIPITAKTVNELQSRINAKRKEGYKEISELKDSNALAPEYNKESNNLVLKTYLDLYLPKYSTTDEGFILPMLAKTLEDNKPFEKNGTHLGQWKINGLRCIIGIEKTEGDLFRPYRCTYTSREGTKWNLVWMDDIILNHISNELRDMMIEEGACLDGELYLPGYSVNDINSFVKNPSLPQHFMLQYWCYDICIENMSAEARNNLRIAEITTPILDVTCKEIHLNNKDQFIKLPTAYDLESIEDAIFLRNKFIDLGFEGLILRNPNAEYQFGKRNLSMLKFKKIDDGLFSITAINVDKRGLPVFTLKNDINDELFDCTINLPQNEQRRLVDMKDTIIGKVALVEFRERSGVKQVPFHAKIIKINE